MYLACANGKSGKDGTGTENGTGGDEDGSVIFGVGLSGETGGETGGGVGLCFANFR